MPSHRNDITRKPIMTSTTRRACWQAVDENNEIRTIWADSEEEAEEHAKEQGWSLQQEE